jgi:hypothetical protein
VSHLPERTEKICLNCNADIHGRYCHVCGQENLEPKETFWHLITHFIYDITHFDGNFFSTVKYLLFKPGFLSAEYARGRRASYLNPIRMYIFTSAIFFIIFFSFVRKSSKEDDNDTTAKQEFVVQKNLLVNQYNAEKDSVRKQELKKQIKKLQKAQAALENSNFIVYDEELETDSVKTNKKVFGQKDSEPKTIAAYDSIQKSTPADKKDNWFERMYMRKKISINQKYDGRSKDFWKDIQEKFAHSIPQMMFVSLPLIAMIFQLLYFRRKQFVYVHHGIFAIHNYIAIYLILLAVYFISALKSWTGWSVFTFINVILVLSMFFYVYKAMRNFYKQSRGKTILKYFILFLLCVLIFSLLMLIFLLTSALQI